MSRLTLISKPALLSLCHNLGINYLLRERERGHLLVLCYHGIVPDEYAADPLGYGTMVGMSDFGEQIAMLTRLFYPISVSQLKDWWSGKASLPPNPVLLTFDDGYRNNLTHAAPLLARFGVPALINVCVGYIGGNRILWPNEIYRRVLYWPKPMIPMPDFETERPIPTDIADRVTLADYIRQLCKSLPASSCDNYLNLLRQYDPPKTDDYEQETLAFLSWDEVRTLQNMGFEIGSHTVEHPILSRLSAQQVAQELEQSKSDIEQVLGTECSCFTYPNGTVADVSDTVIEAVRRVGYQFGFTGIAGFCSNTGDPLTLSRIPMPGRLTRTEFQSRVSGLYSRMQVLLHTTRDLIRRQRASGGKVILDNTNNDLFGRIPRGDSDVSSLLPQPVKLECLKNETEDPGDDDRL